MARLNQVIQEDSNDEFPDLSEVLKEGGSGAVTLKSGWEKEHSDVGHPMTRDKNNLAVNSTERNELPSKSVTNALCEEKQARRQRRPRVNSLLLPISNGALSNAKCFDGDQTIARTHTAIRSSPKRSVKSPIDYSIFAEALSDFEVSTSEGDSADTDLSGFIVFDSATEEEDSSRSKPRKERRWWAQKTGGHVPSKTKEGATILFRSPEDIATIDLTSPKKDQSDFECSETPPASKSPYKTHENTLGLSVLDEPFATLRFSPPRSRSPHKRQDNPRPVTPPSSPSKSKLQSPSKRTRIPSTPHHPGIDAFWSQDVINDWNDQYSPKKPPKSTHRNRLFIVDGDGEAFSPSTSPRKSSSKSPIARDKAATEQLKAFIQTKHSLAITFLALVDKTLTNARVSALAAPAGGIKLHWSKKLTSTAGRANWRKETIHPTTLNDTATYLHHASIELAEKIIDNEHRLLNVIAHEYCHLATFMISGIRTNPHGREFKAWATRCTNAFAHRGVKVTTTHSYTITYKYIWACSNETCGVEYKRHSKSIDTTRHSCGKCKGKLVQIQPVPRKEGKGGGGEYQAFVKREFERVRRENPARGWGEIMALLGKEFRKGKKGRECDVGNGDDGHGHAETFEHPGDVGDVLKGLNSLSLGT